jgi:hypothetical protein
MNTLRNQAVTGLVPPQLGEAKIREAWPSVTAFPALASMGRKLMLTKFLAPFGWFLLLPVYFFKLVPFVATRYTLSNRALMIQKGLKPVPVRSVALTDIEDVQIKTDENTEFFRAATLEIWSKGEVVLTLPGVPEADAFAQAIRNACAAWGRTSTEPPASWIPASAGK